MKNIRFSPIIVVMIIVMFLFVGCGSDDEGSLAQKMNQAETDDTKDKEVTDDVEESETSTSEGEEDEQDDSQTEEVDDDEAKDEEELEEEIIEEEIVSEYQVLDVSETEDEDNYETGLVFIVQEEDLWRVVDRKGRVFRVSSSYEKIAPGIVNNGATVELDEEGDINVSLIRDYTFYDNSYIVESSLDSLAGTFSQRLLDDQLKAASSSKVDEAILNSASIINSLKKGIHTITMNIDVKPSANAENWGEIDADGWIRNMEYTYTVYGYETTWILPVKEPLYSQVGGQAVSQDLSDEDESSEEELAQTEETEEEETGDAGVFNATTLQTVIAEADGRILYFDKVLLAQSDALQGTNTYEHEGSLNIFVNGSTIKLEDAQRNGTYEKIIHYSTKVYLFKMIHPPSSEVIYTGLSVVDLNTGVYRTLYNGGVEDGIGIDDKYYVFGTDSLMEIDLDDNSLRVVTTLPQVLDFSYDNVKVLEVESSIMTVEIEIDATIKTYEINIINGDFTEV